MARRPARSWRPSVAATSSTGTGRVAPLRPAADARIIVTDGNRFEDTVEAVTNAIRDVEARR